MMKQLVKPLAFAVAALPFIYIAYQIYLVTSGMPNELGADPADKIVLFNGTWALRFLLITLSMTPLRDLLRSSWPIRIRRLLGLYCFFYASLHVASYLVFLLGWQLDDLVADVIKRPYITAGFLAYLLLIPLASTSNRRMLRRLGKNWKILHRAIYAIGILAVIHFIWQTRSDYGEPLMYALILATLLGYRIVSARPWTAMRPIVKTAESRKFILNSGP